MVSIQTGKTHSFSTVDYAMFVCVLLVSAVIGFYFAWIDRKKTTVKDYMLAGGNMKTLPVALSLVASFMSAITLLGTPVEMYLYSTIYAYIGISYIFVMAAAAHIYIPVFYRLRITSSFEYLSMRFGKGVRTVAAGIYICQMMLYMSIVLFAPSLALNAVTGIDLWGSIISVGTICTVYTAFGGMKAVLWTDCFQVGMMLVGYLAILIQGSIETDGFAKAWDIMDKADRVDFTDFDPDPTVRHTFWSLTVGGYFVWVAVYGCNQAMVQRACSLPTLKRAQVAFWLNVPGLWIILYLGCLIGVVMFAYYHACDPVTSKIITKKDQLLPLFVMDVLGDMKGLPGLFVAGLFSGALSTISSGLNAVAAVVLEDFIRAFCYKDLTDLRATRVSQILALVFGCVCLGLTWVASKLGNVLQAALALYGMLSGPMLGIFTLGMIFPRTNHFGALVALLTSLPLTFSLGIGKFVHKPKPRPPPSKVFTYGCGFNFTAAIKQVTKIEDVSPWFSVSYLWYGSYAVIWIILIGNLVSFLSGAQKPEKLDPRLVCPIFDILPPFRWLPERYRAWLRFGVRHDLAHIDYAERLRQLELLGKISEKKLFDQSLTVSSMSNAHLYLGCKSGEEPSSRPVSAIKDQEEKPTTAAGVEGDGGLTTDRRESTSATKATRSDGTSGQGQGATMAKRSDSKSSQGQGATMAKRSDSKSSQGQGAVKPKRSDSTDSRGKRLSTSKTTPK